tara:strand:- start:23 stop:961 length:939 start_codon:yes stop_codon:yes gene_type:complete
MNDDFFNQLVTSTMFPDIKGLDTKTGNTVNLSQLFKDQLKNNKKDKKLDKQFVLPDNATAQDVIDIYGTNLPTNLQTELGVGFSNVPINVPEGKEIFKKKIGGKQVIVDKDRPKTRFARVIAGIQDYFDPTKDRDKLGGIIKKDESGKYYYDKTGGLTVVDSKDPKQRVLSPYQQKVVQDYTKDKFGVEPSATEGIQENMAVLKDIVEEQNKINRNQRREAAIDSFAMEQLTFPFRMRNLENVAKTRLELDKAMLGAREMMPSNIQNIMASKQQQQALASLSESERAKAIAAQQSAANEFGGLGIARRFAGA